MALQCLGPEVVASSNNNSLLYSVTAESGAKSHVFGTIHIADSSVFMQRDTVLKILDESRVFFAELDLDSMLGGLSPTMMMLPAGQTLADFYTEDEFDEITAVLKEKLGPMAMMANRMKPAAVAALLMFSDMDEAPQSNTSSIDEFLWSRAKSSGVRTGGLELISEQVGVLDKMPPRFLLEAVRATEDDSEDILQELVTAYAEEDLETISAMVDSLSSIESFMATLNDERNVRMAERVAPELDKGKVFVAVGSAHLAGPHGLLKILREHGYTVSPVLGGTRTQWLKYPSNDTD